MVAINKTFIMSAILLCLASLAIAQINIPADKWFTSDTEYIRFNINDELPHTLIMNTNEFGIPFNDFDIIAKTDYYDYQSELYYYWEYRNNSKDFYNLSSNLKTMDFMLRYRYNDWKFGLATVLREKQTIKITYDNYFRAELSRSFHTINSDTEVKLFIEKNIDKTDYAPSIYETSGLFTFYDYGLSSDHNIGIDLSSESPKSKTDKVDISYFPLVYSPAKSYSIKAGFDYFSAKSKGAFPFYIKSDNVTEAWANTSYKLYKQLDFTCSGQIYNMTYHDNYGFYYDNETLRFSGYKFITGMTVYPFSYKDFCLLLNLSCWYSEYHLDDNDQTTVGSYIIPTGGVYYRFNPNLVLNCLFSRNYSTRDDQHYVDFYQNDHSWNFYLGLNAGY